MFRPYVRCYWRSWLLGIYVDGEYDDLVDAMIGIGPLWLCVQYHKAGA
jgi:hypothetical protein